MMRKQVMVYLLAGIVVILVVLALTLAATSLPVPRILPESRSEISALTRIGFEFQQPMQQEEVVERLRIDSKLKFNLIWEKNTLWIHPISGFEPGATFSIRLEAGARSLDGKVIGQSVEKRFVIRQPGVIFLSTLEKSLKFTYLNGSEVRQVSPAGMNVNEFSASHDGDWIAFSAANEQKGADIWIVDRNGKEERRLLSCGAEVCSSPAWAPDGNQLAFLRRNQAEAFARPWLVERPSGQTSPIYDDPGISGMDFAWSPDGRFISTYDTTVKAIRIFDLLTAQTILIKSQAQTAGAFSRDARRFYYFDQDTTSLPPIGRAFVLELDSGRATRLFARSQPELDYGLPLPDVSGETILVARRLAFGSHSMQLWLLDAEASREELISADFLTTRGAYSWDATGVRVVFQQLPLGTSRAEPEVLVWDRSTQTITRIARQAARPAWLP